MSSLDVGKSATQNGIVKAESKLKELIKEMPRENKFPHTYTNRNNNMEICQFLS